MNILILCTGNSARSIMGEALVSRLSGGRMQSFSAGSAPTGKVNSFAISQLQSKGYETGKYRSKSWDVFTGDEAPIMDIIITVCDNAAGETCPIWATDETGKRPLTVHWSFPDPASINGTDKDISDAFSRVYDHMEKHVQAMVSLPLERMSESEQRENLNAIYNELQTG